MSEETIENIDIQKAESNPTASSSRIKFGEMGNPYIKTVGGIIKEEARRELQYPRSLKTYDEMRENATVAAGLTVNEVFLTKALMGMKIKAGVSGSEKSKQFADYLNWNIKNLTNQTWYDVITGIISYQQYGFSWLEKVYEKNNSSTFDFPYKLKKLAPRSQRSIERWIIDEDGREVKGLKQYPSTLLSNPHGDFLRTTSTGNMSVTIPRNKFLLFSWDNKTNNPQGISPLNGCYRAYKELSLIAAYEVCGVSKDLSGVLVLRVPTDIINKAAEDPSSDEAKSVASLQKNAANVNAGDQSYILLGSDTIDGSGTGKYSYDMSLQGVEGGSKSYKTTELIQERKKQILDSLGAGFLNLGNDGVGSYALSTGKQSLHAFFMERHLLFIKSVIENDLFKQLAEINNVKLEQDDMPVIEFGELDEPDLDLISSALQRMGSVGLIPKKKEFILPIFESMGLDISSLESLSQEELDKLMTENTSRGGDGQGSSGVGNSQLGGAGTKTNSANAA